MKSVIHDWDDSAASAILLNCRKSASATTRLLLIERVMPEVMTVSAANQRAAILDIQMLAIAGAANAPSANIRIYWL
ncbi:MAG: hypothetical protein JOY90_01870 [Bradyrhizobium sp.]|nr:hypothetical protein [Bradyrhizobium sp.]